MSGNVLSVTRRGTCLLRALTNSLPILIVSSRQIAPTTASSFSHHRLHHERNDKKAELLSRAASDSCTSSQRRIGLPRIHNFSNSIGSLILRGFQRSYSCDSTKELRENGSEMARDPAADQLPNYKKNMKGDPPVLLTGNGAPIANKTASLTVGARGPMLLQDFVYLDEMSHFDRERIPERVVHAKGAGAFGYFEVTHDITQYSKAKVFSGIGKRTPIATRFSTVGGESGSADTVRDPRGFAVKFYTEEGIWDLVGNNTPIFFIKDPLLFPSFIHTQKRNPQTHLKDADMFWDFISLRPETTHQVTILFGDRGIPDGHRHMNGYGSHTFKLINDRDEMVYTKFHWKTDQGIRNLLAEKALEISATDPDYSIRDLYNAIATENCPSWTLWIQVMTLQEADTFRWNPFDLTKVWPQKEFPLIPVGRMVLDRNPDNYFSDVEQLAFDPAHMPPGIEPSPDKMLQGRLFAYGDTHRHRLGPNHMQLAVNCPYKVFSKINYQRDGLMTIYNSEGAPNYYPNSFGGPQPCPGVKDPSFYVAGNVDRHEPVNEDDFSQAGTLYRDIFDDAAKRRFEKALIDSLRHASNFIVERAVKNFSEVDINLGKILSDGLRRAGKNINISRKSANL